MMKQERLIEMDPKPALAGRDTGWVKLFGHHAYHARKEGGRIFE